MKLNLSVLLFFAAFTGILFPQGGSVYTRLGLGDNQFSYSGRRLGMGDLGTSVADEDYISTLNPAGWNKLTRTRIEFGYYYYGTSISDNSNKTFSANSKFTGFAIAFPASYLYGIGIAAGLVPVTSVDYKVNQTIITNNSSVGNYDISYEGNGGLSKIFIGSSYKLPFDLSIGATLDYYFGNLTYISRISFVDQTNLTAEYTRKYQVRGIGSTLGMISPDLLKSDENSTVRELRLGVSMTLGSNASVDTMLISSSSLSRDTVNSAEVDMHIPFRISAGISALLNQRYLVMVDYYYQPWSKLTINNLAQSSVRDMMKFSAGVEYKPVRELGATFWDEIVFRLGAGYEQTQYSVNGTGIDKISVSGGISFPVSTANTLDIGAEYFMRGTTDNSLFKENGFRMSFGVSLGDVWFMREER